MPPCVRRLSTRRRRCCITLSSRSTLSLGTVYRNLSVLAEEGLVVSVAHVNGQERYDARVEPHTHLICRHCARVIDLLELEDAISGMYGEIEHRFGCLPESHTLTVSGLCPNCRAAAD